ncbi:RHS repeat-associated core domain-containing protein [Pseudomonas sp. 21LCFQ010]|uniref:RHS repeat-associated core domain-containing protein n=1 Tax=Pseudomonas sp. 21LCFQ010 TaxID=2957506 RepID=UPI002096AAE2|nr:RHS repeat-associated core domain-containing protein [Pseudomonas sp. 21LCFQ010]MCO8161603.1 RHS repeat-associated core domain-containing protein [Pseudomonas sp. 21LCFQ010]
MTEQRTLLRGHPGFNGELCDPLTGHYLLGNGYRAYNPVLMRFNSPDSLSPFGEGGLNAYAYCQADPVNRIDPNGHLSVSAIKLWLYGAATAMYSAGTAALASSLRAFSQGNFVRGMGYGAASVGLASSGSLVATIAYRYPNLTSRQMWVLPAKLRRPVEKYMLMNPLPSSELTGLVEQHLRTEPPLLSNFLAPPPYSESATVELSTFIRPPAYEPPTLSRAAAMRNGSDEIRADLAAR